MEQRTSDPDESESLVEKLCKSCDTNKPTSAFNKDKTHSDGLRSSCKSCAKKALANPNRRRIVHVARPPGQKRCPKCRNNKPHEAFSPDITSKDGFHAHCKDCVTKTELRGDRPPRTWRRQVIGATSKLCSRCGEDKPMDQYFVDKSHADGYGSQCKPCKYEYLNTYNATKRA
ncbi:unnamed protein product, partial [Phaeothamnion confervicola]